MSTAKTGSESHMTSESQITVYVGRNGAGKTCALGGKNGKTRNFSGYCREVEESCDTRIMDSFMAVFPQHQNEYGRSWGEEYTMCLLRFLWVVEAEVVTVDNLAWPLHPLAGQALVAEIRKILQARPWLRVVATTHSPYLLDWFKAEEVRVFVRAADGTVHTRPLTECPEYEHLSGFMAPGEIWAHVGEDWVIDGKPHGFEIPSRCAEVKAT